MLHEPGRERERERERDVIGIHNDISENELKIICDREKIFDEKESEREEREREGVVSVGIPREGDMYDVVTTSSNNVLQSVN
mmetsp:Transcript_38579/g.39269  ORF Transcript_38579/g.39269 Transcript_38579/m.39269 type:complete len:82 (-) Transcript_38579:278-523(-)